MVFMENQTGTELSGVIVKVGVNDGRLKIGPSDSLLPGFLDDCALLCFARASRSDYASLSCTSKRFYRLLGSDVLYELRKRLGIVEHWVFLVCDPMQWEAFDPLRDRWMTMPKIPCDECFTFSDKESLAVDNELLVFGVELTGLTIWKFSMIRRRWVKCEAMNQPRCLFGSGSFGTLAIIAGGCDRRGNILQSAELYDSKTGRWEILPDLHSPRKMCSGFFMDGKFYVIGGMSGPGASLTFGEEFDFETWSWRKIEGMYPDVNRASEAPPLVAVVENELYAVDRSTNMVKKYDKEKNSWDVLGRLPIRADVSFGWGLAFKACGNQLLVVGGERGHHGAATVVNSWSPKSGVSNGSLEWKVLGAKNLGSVFVYNCAVMGC